MSGLWGRWELKHGPGMPSSGRWWRSTRSRRRWRKRWKGLKRRGWRWWKGQPRARSLRSPWTGRRNQKTSLRRRTSTQRWQSTEMGCWRKASGRSSGTCSGSAQPARDGATSTRAMSWGWTLGAEDARLQGAQQTGRVERSGSWKAWKLRSQACTRTTWWRWGTSRRSPSWEAWCSSWLNSRFFEQTSLENQTAGWMKKRKREKMHEWWLNSHTQGLSVVAEQPH